MIGIYVYFHAILKQKWSTGEGGGGGGGNEYYSAKVRSAVCKILGKFKNTVFIDASLFSKTFIDTSLFMYEAKLVACTNYQLKIYKRSHITAVLDDKQFCVICTLFGKCQGNSNPKTPGPAREQQTYCRSCNKTFSLDKIAKID